MPAHAAVPPLAAEPRLVGAPLAAAADTPASSERRYAPDRMPTFVPGTRSETRKVLVGVWSDESGSTATTDPRMARRHDIVRVLIPWMARELPHDLIAVGCFDDQACASGVASA